MGALEVAQRIILGLSEDYAPILVQLQNSMVRIPDLESLEDQMLMHKEFPKKLSKKLVYPRPEVNAADVNAAETTIQRAG